MATSRYAIECRGPSGSYLREALLAAYSMTPAGHKCSFIEMCHKLLVCTGTKNGGAAHDAAHEIAKHVRKFAGGLVLSQA